MERLKAVTCPITHETKFVSLADLTDITKYDVSTNEQGETFAISKDDEERLRRIGNHAKGCFSLILFAFIAATLATVGFVVKKEYNKSKKINGISCIKEKGTKKVPTFDAKNFYEFSNLINKRQR